MVRRCFVAVWSKLRTKSVSINEKKKSSVLKRGRSDGENVEMAYVLMSGITYCFSMLYDHSRKNSHGHRSLELKHKQCDIILKVMICLPAIITGAIRYNIGVDYLPTYWASYIAVLNGRTRVTGSSVSIEIGWVWLNQFLQIFSESPIIFFVFTSVVIYGLLFKYIYRTENKIALPILFFFLSGLYFSSYNIVRQFLALSIVMNGSKWLYGKKFIPYLCVCVLASFVHLSAIILLPMFFLSRWKLSRKGFFIALLCAMAGGPLIAYVMNVLLRNTRYVYYLTSILYKIDADISGLVFGTIITIMVLFLYDRLKSQERFQLFFAYLLCYDVLLILSFFFPLANRISIYFKVPVFVNLLPEAIQAISRRNRGLVKAGIVVFMILACYYLYVVRELSGVFPYQTLFSSYFT